MLVAFTANAQSCPDNNHPHMIDLGLPSGTKWACCNVEADKPEAYGGYYAWGETKEHDDLIYNWSTYTHCDGDRDTCYDLGSDIAGTQYDVAHVKWGGSWVMPSREQIEELGNNCTYESMTVNGVYMGKFTSKINGESIFMPAAGIYMNENVTLNGSYGYYWSSTHDSSSAYRSVGLQFQWNAWGFDPFNDRSYGRTVRPVCTSPVKLSNIRGDVNGDKAINITDVAMMTTHIMGDFNKDFLSANADLNNDGDINITDVVTAVNIILTGKGVSSIELPEGAEISASDLTIYSDGEQVDAGDNGLLGACVGDMIAFNGDDLVYLSYGSQNDDRTLNSLETAISLLLPIIPYAVTDMDDDSFWLLKQMIGHLEQTRELASAIDQSIIDKGYLDMDAINPQHLTAVAELKRRLGIDGSAPSYSPRMKSKRTNYPFFLNAGKELQGDGFTLIKDHSIWGTGKMGDCWKCEFTVLNADRWCYTSLTKAMKDENGYPKRIDEGFSGTFTYLIKPNNISALMDFGSLSDLATNPKEFLSVLSDPDFDRVINQLWEPLKNLGHIIRGEETETVTFDKVKKSGIELNLYPGNEHLMIFGPGEDGRLLLFNIVKVVFQPTMKLIMKEVVKTDGYKNSEDMDKFFVQFVKFIVEEGDPQFPAKLLAIIDDPELTWYDKVVKIYDEIKDKMSMFLVKDVLIKYMSEAAFEGMFENVADAYNDPQIKNVFTAYKTMLTAGDILMFLIDSNYDRIGFEIDYGPSYESYHERKSETFTVGDATFTMMTLPGGPFIMGAEPGDEDATGNEKPLHYVNIDRFAIGESEVTQRLWEAVMGSNPSKFVNGNRPVDNVSWLDCQEFITKLNQLTGRNFRLPTEAEWEFAACGGMYKRGYLYAGSENIGDVAWYKGNSNETQPVRLLNANEFGLYDMSGNVMEWCQDFYDPNYYGNSPENNPCCDTQPIGYFPNRVLRGGNWYWDAEHSRVTYRTNNGQGVKSEIYGLRLAMDDQTLQLSTYTLNLTIGGQGTVDIITGSERYAMVNNTPSVVDAVMENNTIIITAKSADEAVVTVKDTKTGQEVELHVNVTAAQTETISVNGVSFKMVGVEGGMFFMGAAPDDKDASEYERPIHQVKLSSFTIGETEVTQALWKAVMGSNPSKFQGDKNPVDNVSWLDCQEFITKLNQLTGRTFRLPTEAEWEYAARGGVCNNGYKFSGSNDAKYVAWYKENSDKKTHPVGQMQANAIGLHDMSGNVMEWCKDFYAPKYYSHSAEENPCCDILPTGSFPNRVLRGGNWYWEDNYCRVSSRSDNGQGVDSEIYGLRLAMDVDQLVLSTNSITVSALTSSSVQIISGSGSYEVESVVPSGIVTASIINNSIVAIEALTAGTAIITIKDNLTKEVAEIEVTVSGSPQSYLTCPDDHHPHLIDLGLPSGTKWACCNVDDDASKQTPTNYGSYYAWGETEEKDYYDWSTYTHCDGLSGTCHDLGSDIAGTQYDVAHVKWGGSWVMPTHDQLMELLDNCTYEWTTVNGVRGGKFTSKTNGGSIFLPAAGYRWNGGLYYAGSYGFYWSSTELPSLSSLAYYLDFTSDYSYWYGYDDRDSGHTVRPVSR